jgi:hypothetical protein
MYKVYWTDRDGKPDAEEFSDLTQALKVSHSLRNDGFEHVVMSSQVKNSVGKPGVDSVIDGVLPNGDIYEWKMRRTQ